MKSLFLTIYSITLERRYGFVREHYKCLEPKFPSSNVAVFVKDEYGNLKLKTIEKVKNIHNPSSFHDLVYNINGRGDSGGPISAKTKLSNEHSTTSNSIEDKRHVMLAIFTNGRGIAAKNICKSTGTKMSEGIVSWIKKLESMDVNSGEKMP